MNKNVVLSVVIFILFAASGVIVYFGIFNQPSVNSIPIEVNQQNIVNLLPYGEDLSFDVLDDRPGVLPPFVYRKVNPAQDVGLQPRDMLKNPPAAETPGEAPALLF